MKLQECEQYLPLGAVQRAGTQEEQPDNLDHRELEDLVSVVTDSGDIYIIGRAEDAYMQHIY